MNADKCEMDRSHGTKLASHRMARWLEEPGRLWQFLWGSRAHRDLQSNDKPGSATARTVIIGDHRYVLRPGDSEW